MAIHEDTLPQLETQCRALQSQGNSLAAEELFVRITTENEKRQRWAVRVYVPSRKKERHIMQKD